MCPLFTKDTPLESLTLESDSTIGYLWIFLVDTPQPTSNDCNSSSFHNSHLGAASLACVFFGRGAGVTATAAATAAACVFFGRGAGRGAGVAATAAAAVPLT